jgi:hypothetical protein
MTLHGDPDKRTFIPFDIVISRHNIGHPTTAFLNLLLESYVPEYVTLDQEGKRDMMKKLIREIDEEDRRLGESTQDQSYIKMFYMEDILQNLKESLDTPYFFVEIMRLVKDRNARIDTIPLTFEKNKKDNTIRLAMKVNSYEIGPDSNYISFNYLLNENGVMYNVGIVQDGKVYFGEYASKYIKSLFDAYSSEDLAKIREQSDVFDLRVYPDFKAVLEYAPDDPITVLTQTDDTNIDPLGVIDNPLEQIMMEMDPDSLVNFCVTNKRSALLCRDKTFWRKKVVRDFGHIPTDNGVFDYPRKYWQLFRRNGNYEDLYIENLNRIGYIWRVFVKIEFMNPLREIKRVVTVGTSPGGWRKSGYIIYTLEVKMDIFDSDTKDSRDGNIYIRSLGNYGIPVPDQHNYKKWLDDNGYIEIDYIAPRDLSFLEDAFNGRESDTTEGYTKDGRYYMQIEA